MPTTLLRRLVRGAARRSESGQVLIIVAAGLLALIAMVGLVIDGGYAWGRQRMTANGADAVAKAGTVVVLEWLDTKPKTMGDVGCAVDLAEAENGVIVERAEFTDHTGELINVVVPDCVPGGGGAIPPTAQGVRVVASQTFETFLMSIVGIRQLTATANATAVVGPITGSGVGLPVTFPQTMELCDDSGDTHTIRDWDEPNYDGSGANDGTWTPFEILPLGATLDASNEAIIPLCTTAPGSVGWLDYGCGNLADQIEDPCDIFVSIPGWLETHTGNINCCEDELATYHGNQPGVYEEDGVDTDGNYDVPVKLPIHTTTCEDAPVPGTFDSDGDGDHDTLDWRAPGASGTARATTWTTACRSGSPSSSTRRTSRATTTSASRPPGNPQLVNPSGLTGCLKGWFVERIGPPDAVSIGDVNPGDEVDLGMTLIN